MHFLFAKTLIMLVLVLFTHGCKSANEKTLNRQPTYEEGSTTSKFSMTPTPENLCKQVLAQHLLPCPEDKSKLCNFESAGSVCVVGQSFNGLPYCTSEEGKGYGKPRPCPQKDGGLCSWDDISYSTPCIPIYSQTKIPFCFTNMGKGEGPHRACDGQVLPCAFWTLDNGFECLADRAMNHLPYCIQRNGLGIGNPFPCNKGKGLLCAIRFPDNPGDWCVLKGQ